MSSDRLPVSQGRSVAKDLLLHGPLLSSKNPQKPFANGMCQMKHTNKKHKKHLFLLINPSTLVDGRLCKPRRHLCRSPMVYSRIWSWPLMLLCPVFELPRIYGVVC